MKEGFASENDRSEEERYWNEEQWESYLQERRAEEERYLEAMEDEILSDEEDGTPISEYNLGPESSGVIWDELEDPEDEEEVSDWKYSDYDDDEEEWDQDDEGEDDLSDLEEIPAWRAAYDFGNTAREFLSRHCDGVNVPPDIECLCQNSYQIAAEIAEGHELGYENETICGNIVKCRWALDCTEQCISALKSLSQTYFEAGNLLEHAKLVRSFIRVRIEELRKQVWW